MKAKVLGISLTLLITLVIVFSIVLFNKYRSFNILSIEREYNKVITDSEDTLKIPLYLEKKDSFLTDKKRVTKVSFSSDDYKLETNIISIENTSRIEYKDKKYYEFYYEVSFLSYDSFSEPIFLENAYMNISYDNGNQMSYKIGNMNLYFNSDITDTNLTITDLSSVCNIVNNVDTIVGINITIRSNVNNITLKSIKIKNKFYDLDNSFYLKTELNTRDNLTSFYKNYEYTTISISNNPIDVLLNAGDTFTAFIPIKYLNNIRYLDSFPLYISYDRLDNSYAYVMNDFTFLNKNTFGSRNGLTEYEYNYH